MLFSGKRKFITIPILGIIGLVYLPITLGIIAIWFSYKKINNESVRLLTIIILGLFTIIFGTRWVVAIFSPSSSTKENTPVSTQEVEGERATPTVFQPPTPTPTLTPTPTPSAEPTIMSTSTPYPTIKPTSTSKPTVKTTSTSDPTPIPTPTQAQTSNTGNQYYSPPASSGRYTCNCQKTCGNMSSCEEAYFQLNTCGCQARDGDNDGVPCESIC